MQVMTFPIVFSSTSVRGREDRSKFRYIEQIFMYVTNLVRFGRKKTYRMRGEKYTLKLGYYAF